MKLSAEQKVLLRDSIRTTEWGHYIGEDPGLLGGLVLHCDLSLTVTAMNYNNYSCVMGSHAIITLKERHAQKLRSQYANLTKSREEDARATLLDFAIGCLEGRLPLRGSRKDKHGHYYTRVIKARTFTVWH